MDPGRQPESAEDFDRLVLSSPSSSLLWLQYMAFHLQATEIEKARAVAERALKTISFRSRPRRPALGPVFPQGGPCFLHRPAAVGLLYRLGKLSPEQGATWPPRHSEQGAGSRQAATAQICAFRAGRGDTGPA